MATTVPGGRYLTSDGRVVDAFGRDLPATLEPALPEGFPYREALEAAGFVTLALIEGASDADLLAVPTIGKAAVRAIRAA